MLARLARLIGVLVLIAAPAAAESGTDRLGRELAALEAWVRANGGTLGAELVDLGSEQVLAGTHADQALNPASNAKLFTAAAALAQLGPGYRWTTAVHGRMNEGSARRLVLRGHGDPTLASADLAGLARQLASMGLRRVESGVIVDQSRFDTRYVPPAFEQQPDEWASFRAPVSAVAVERNAITVHVLPTKAGQPAKVWLEPPGFAALQARVETAPRGKGQRLAVTLTPRDGRLRVVVSGHLAMGLPQVRLRRRVDDPRTLAGHVLVHFLRAAGVTVEGVVGQGSSADEPVLVTHRSQPLASVLHALGKQSDNFTAEMLLKTMGAEASGGSGSSASGARVVDEWLQVAGARAASTRVVNGSGLFDANRASARTLTRALVAAYRDPAIGHELVAQLAVGGVDGTLRSRFRSHAKTRRIRAKTGTLARVIALSGYVLGERPLAFSIVVNGVAGKHPELRRRIDRVVEAAAAGR